MYSEDDLLPLSALQHLAYCPRQCALIHVEQAWAENRFTAEGRVMHEKAHDADAVECREGVRIERGMSLRCLRLGLIGKADVVEFHRLPDGKGWVIFPVEYKRGKPKEDDCDKVQLCAQALCLEEMRGDVIPCGAIYYGKIRRRLDVAFDDSLRREVEAAAKRLHALIRSGETPLPVYSEKCEACSLAGLCLPKTLGESGDVASYMRAGLSNI